MTGGRSGYSALEYVLLVVAVVVASVGIRRYLQFAIQGRLNEARWTISEQSQPGADPARGILAQWTYELQSTERTNAVPTDAKTITLPFTTFQQQQLQLTVDTKVTREAVTTCESYDVGRPCAP